MEANGCKKSIWFDAIYIYRDVGNSDSLSCFLYKYPVLLQINMSPSIFAVTDGVQVEKISDELQNLQIPFK